MIRLLIAGSGGMTGSELARQASLHGFDSVAMSRKELDISDRRAADEAVRRVKPNVVINAAAYTAVDSAERDRTAAERTNRYGAGYLALAAANAGARFVHISTDYVFDGTASRPYQPDDPVSPLGVYGESKAAGEEAVRMAGGVHAIIRTAWVYSGRGRNFLTTMKRLAAEGRDIRVVDDQRGTPTSASDLAAALLRVASRLHEEPSLSGTYHFTNAGEATWFEFARAIFDEGGGTPPVITAIRSSDFPTLARRPAYSVLDTSSFERAFDVTPRPWRDALRDQMERLN